MYKMVLIDLDGTLLDDKKQVSKRNADIIQKIHKEKGVYFVIATGKNLNDITQVIEAIGNPINQYIIASNGALIKDNIKNDYILKNYLQKEEVLDLIDIYKKQNLRGIIHTYNYQITDEAVEARNNKHIKLVQNLKKYYQENDMKTTSMLTLCGKEENLQKTRKRIKEKFDKIETTNICDFMIDIGTEIYSTKYIDIMRKNATKANAIKILADYLQINKDEIVVMGDGANDISMFEMSGYKVAMGNANQNLKEKADYITEDNNQDGVAKALEKIFYGEEIS